MPISTQSRAHILVVDDYEPIRKVVRSILELHGFHVSEAATGPDAITKAFTAEPDLLLLDLAIPGVSGIGVATFLRQQLPRLPIIALTMYESVAEETLGDGFAIFGISDVVSKSTGLNSLL